VLTLLSDGARRELLDLIDERISLRAESAEDFNTPWMTVSEAAQHLRTTSGAIYKRIRRGQLAATRPPGSQILIHRDALNRPGPEEHGVL
jgi:excisionase family DNA binding protein